MSCHQQRSRTFGLSSSYLDGRCGFLIPIRHVAVLLLVLGITESSSCCIAQERNWLDATGKQTFTAELVDVQRDIVTLRKANGLAISLRASKLSAKDIDYLQSTGKLLNKYVLTVQDRTGEIAHSAVPFTAVRLKGKDRSWILPGLTFESEKFGSETIALAVRDTPLITGDSELFLHPDIQANELAVTPTSFTRFLHPAAPQARKIRIKSRIQNKRPVETTSLQGLEKGDSIAISWCISRSGAKPKLEVIQTNSKIASVEVDAEGVATGLKVQVRQRFENAIGVATDENGKIFGMVFPTAAKFDRKKNKIVDKDLVSVIGISTIYEPRLPALKRLFGNAKFEGKMKLHFFVVTDRLESKELYFRVSKISDRNIKPVTISNPDVLLKPVATKDASAAFPEVKFLDGDVIYSGSVELDEFNPNAKYWYVQGRVGFRDDDNWVTTNERSFEVKRNN